MDINHEAPATAHGKLQIAADPQTVFSVISAIDQWPSWNPGVRSVDLGGPIEPGTVFRWKAGPSTLTSTLQVVDPPREIAWTGSTMGIGARDLAQRPGPQAAGSSKSDTRGLAAVVAARGRQPLPDTRTSAGGGLLRLAARTPGRVKNCPSS